MFYKLLEGLEIIKNSGSDPIRVYTEEFNYIYVELKHPLPEGFANQIKFASWKQMSEKVWFIKV